jgi:hypothetical protein
MLRALVPLTFLVFSSLFFCLPALAEPERFGDWSVEKVNGEMDPTTEVVITTHFSMIAADRIASREFGFRIFGGSLIGFEIDNLIDGKDYWPYCDFDLSSFKVDSAKVRYFSTRDMGGQCDQILPDFVQAWSAGNEAKLKLNDTVGTVSLKGFSAAWKRAIALGRN